MKSLPLLPLLFVLCAATASAQLPVFPFLRWGMSVDEVRQMEGHDPTAPVSRFLHGTSAVIHFRFDEAGGLARIDVDFSLAHESATADVARRTLSDALRVAGGLDLDFGDAAARQEIERPGADCSGDRPTRVASGCLALRSEWSIDDARVQTYAVQTVDGSSGRILHLLTVTPAPMLPSSACEEYIAPDVMSLE